MSKLLATLLAATIMTVSNSALAADRNLTKAEEAKVISLIKNHLRLPATAKIKLGKMISNPYDAYCASVTKSNSEFIPFIISMSEPVGSIDLRQVIMAGDNKYKYQGVINQCAEYGYKLN